MHTEELFDSRWLALVYPPPIRDDPRVKAAEELKNAPNLDANVDYEWVFDYAKEVYLQKMATRDSLDEKAGEIIKYLGGGTGLFTISALLTSSTANRHILALAIPSFLCVLASLFFAILARSPKETPIAPKITGAKRYAEAFVGSKLAKAEFVCQWNLAAEALRVANEIAADRVERSIWAMYSGIVCLSLPFLAAVLR